MEPEFGDVFLSNYRFAEFSGWLPRERLKWPAAALPPLPDEVDASAFQTSMPGQGPETGATKGKEHLSKDPEAVADGQQDTFPGTESAANDDGRQDIRTAKRSPEVVPESPPQNSPSRQTAVQPPEEFPALPRAAAAAAAASEVLKQSHELSDKNLFLDEMSQKKKKDKKVTMESTGWGL